MPMPEAPCYNGVFPLNPYVDNCALPARPRRTLGSAPDQTALLNCNIGSDALRSMDALRGRECSLKGALYGEHEPDGCYFWSVIVEGSTV